VHGELHLLRGSATASACGYNTLASLGREHAALSKDRASTAMNSFTFEPNSTRLGYAHINFLAEGSTATLALRVLISAKGMTWLVASGTFAFLCH
jgi:hypothetical protein